MIPVIHTPQSVSFFAKGKMFTVKNDHTNYQPVVDKINNLSFMPVHEVSDAIDDIVDLIDIKTFIARVSEGRVQINDDTVMFDGKKAHGVIVERLLTMLALGLDVRPLARFMDRLHTNPTFTAIDEMYLFLEAGKMPITPDGCFLAFKYVNADLKSCHPNPDGTYEPHHVGATPSMDRAVCDTNRHQTCSTGFHFCSFDYLPNYGMGGYSTYRIVVVKVAPEDVTAIPSDYNNTKGRACRYVVVAEIPFDDKIKTRYDNKPVVANEGIYDDRDGETEDDDGDLCDRCDDYEHNCTCDDGWDDENGDPETDGEVLQAAVDDSVATTQVADWGNGTFDDPVVEPSIADSAVEVVFRYGKNNRKRMPASKLIRLVEDLGQRGTSRKLGVPRTTIQDWLSRANA